MTLKTNQRRGSVAVENVLLLSLVAGAVLLIAIGLGDRAREVFDELGENTSTPVAENTRILQGRGEGEAVYRTQARVPETPPSLTVIALKSIGLLVVGLTVLGAALSLAVVRRRPVKKDEETVPQVEPVPTKPRPAYLTKRQEILKSLAEEGRRVLHNQLTAKQIMSRRLTKVLPNTTLDEVRATMAEHQLRHVLVCDTRDCLIGVISDRDVAGEKAGTARDAMTSDPITIGPETKASVLVSILLERRISSLPVVQEGQLIGIVTTSDIAMTLQCTLQLVEQLISELEGLTEGRSFVVHDDPAVDELAECTLSA